jgi:hypothetical protein
MYAVSRLLRLAAKLTEKSAKLSVSFVVNVVCRVDLAIVDGLIIAKFVQAQIASSGRCH